MNPARTVTFGTILTVTTVVLATSSPAPEVVSVKGVHLCCGGCQSRAESAFDGIKGISDVSADLNTKVISFKVTDPQVADEGIKALAKAGFFGTATYKGKSLKYPDSGAQKGAKANTLSLKGVHLCCTACVTASQKALQNVKGVTLIDIDRNDEVIKLTGDAIPVEDAVAALNKAGFFCRYSATQK